MNDLITKFLRELSLTEADITELSTGTDTALVTKLIEKTKGTQRDMFLSKDDNIRALKNEASTVAYKDIIGTLKKTYGLTTADLKDPETNELYTATQLIGIVRDLQEKTLKDKYQNASEGKWTAENDKLIAANRALEEALERIKTVDMPALDARYKTEYKNKELTLFLLQHLNAFKLNSTPTSAHLTLLHELELHKYKLVQKDNGDLSVVTSEGMPPMDGDKPVTLDKFINDALTKHQLLKQSNAGQAPTADVVIRPNHAPILIGSNQGNKPTNLLGMSKIREKLDSQGM